jgi:hypothetical protein
VKVFVFLGPTLSHEEARSELDAVYLPPVAQGDLYRAAKEKPFAIGVIDGYFERLPAVWHKEILWALSQRIHVFGAASMGALRAAELSSFGMRGVGEIYQAFSSGELEDDDEVAVAHGDESTGFRAASEAMVNIRATLAQAERSGGIAGDMRLRLEAIAKATFYPERSYPCLLDRGREAGVPEQVLQALREFVASNRVDKKRADALALLRVVRDCCRAEMAPDAPAFTFQHTEAWDQVVGWAEAQPPISLGSESVPAELLAAEVRLLGTKGRVILAGGFSRVAANMLARRHRSDDDQDRLSQVDRSLRDSVGAGDKDGPESGDLFDDWLAEHGLTRETYRDFLVRQAAVDDFKESYGGDVDRHVVDELRWTGHYARVAQRAGAKDRLLLQHGFGAPTLKDAGLTRPELLAWYFEQRLGGPAPHDLRDFLLETGLPTETALEREAVREFMYAKLAEGTGPHSEDSKHGTDPGERERPDTPA